MPDKQFTMYAVEGRRNGRGSMWTLIRLSEQMCVCVCVCASVRECLCVSVCFYWIWNKIQCWNKLKPAEPEQASQARARAGESSALMLAYGHTWAGLRLLIYGHTCVSRSKEDSKYALVLLQCIRYLSAAAELHTLTHTDTHTRAQRHTQPGTHWVGKLRKTLKDVPSCAENHIKGIGT